MEDEIEIDSTASHHPQPQDTPSAATTEKRERSQQDRDETEHQCPICFSDASEVQFASGPCGHAFCLPCLERHLLRMNVSAISREQSRFTAPIETPTLGRCPVCRAETYLLDIEYCESEALTTEDALHSGQKVYQKDFDCLQWPVTGMIFAERQRPPGGGSVGFGSFHFPPHASSDTIGEFLTDIPYTDMSSIPDQMISHSKDRIGFVESHFHRPTRTFRGRLPLLTASCYLDVLLQFSADYSFITDGVIIKRREQLTDLAQIRKVNPLDGTWKVSNNDQASHELVVTGNGFDDTEGNFFIVILPSDTDSQDIPESDPASFRTVRLLNASTMNVVWELPLSQWDRQQCPMGPEINESIHWHSANDVGTEPDSSTFIWTRVKISESVPPNAVNRLGGSSERFFQRVLSPQERVARQGRVPAYHNDAVWGNTFCQGSRVGLASYHFVSPASLDADQPAYVYISYEHPATGQWPPLDNGMPIPPRARFRNVSFPTPRTFCGEIWWQEDYGTTWQGMVKWEYEMTFDTKFCCILTGHVNATTAHHEEEPHEWSRYGESLIYLNAALWDDLRRYRNEQIEADSSSEAARGQQLRERLKEEGASGRIMANIRHVWFSAEEEEGTNPVDYNLE